MENLKLGQEVYRINGNLEIVKKKILAIIHAKNEIQYKLDLSYCNGITKDNIFLTKKKAEIAKQEYLDGLKFKVGDLLIFRQEEYREKEIRIGRVEEIIYGKLPYILTTADERDYRLREKDIVLKIKNEYIENFGNLKELSKSFEEGRKNQSFISSQINREYDLLEQKLKQSFKKQYSWYYKIINKPLFKDRFNYEEDY